jgi:methylenetetrahydrofolate/methylenetetrahydromethanopterin dehydrogenase (NADP+)
MASDKPTILVQLDTDPQPSVFDGVVAVDAGVDRLFRHGQVRPEAVRDLVYGALFTRGPADLHRTALFVGGSDVGAGEAVLKAVKETFFAGFRVSVLFDANGCNTTAAAAALAVVKEVEAQAGKFDGTPVAVLGGTGPVGQRVARLLARLGGVVSIGSRQLERARATAERIAAITGRPVGAFSTADPESLRAGLQGKEVVVAAGAAGVTLLPAEVRRSLPDLKVVVDLNAVPPLGIEGIAATDKGTEREGVRSWGALGIGGTKMKIHKKAIQELFTANDKVLDAEEVLELGRRLG